MILVFFVIITATRNLKSSTILLPTNWTNAEKYTQAHTTQHTPIELWVLLGSFELFGAFCCLCESSWELSWELEASSWVSQLRAESLDVEKTSGQRRRTRKQSAQAKSYQSWKRVSPALTAIRIATSFRFFPWRSVRETLWRIAALCLLSSLLALSLRYLRLLWLLWL